MKTILLLATLLASPALACDVLTILPEDANRGDLPANALGVTGAQGPIFWSELGGVRVEVEPTQTKRGPWCDWSRALVEVRAAVCADYRVCREPGVLCAIRRPSGHWDKAGKCIGWADVHVGDTMPRAGK